MPIPDDYALCLESLKTQLLTLGATYFPASTGRVVGWQISSDDTVVLEGGDYYIIHRPGTFSQSRQGDLLENEWHVSMTLFVRYDEYETAWAKFTAFRNAILMLPETSPLRDNFIDGSKQVFSGSDEAGYLLDDKGALTQFIVQKMDCVIPQRVRRRRSF